MKINWRIIILSGVLIIVVVLISIGFMQYYKNGGIWQSLKTTESIDDVVNSLMQDSDKEVSAIQSDNTDSYYLTSDSQAVSDFGQSYENEF